ncbi:Cytochrome b-c1 complex subunit 7 [Eutypa lata]|uniref:Cytochrome b-c1 complex subunit 7 n=1 Tax=Eutypa lata (strain UCR-EL1) TaxID=1287681 RepID=M7SUW6_EUTLA|nr:putative ubiquinol-cytochrome c reductase complex 14 kda protein [Eutypa lata UCREL1]KAI1250765.1 Cytochrome b-c1 complex subunit 7 [Eutypa lata]
MTYATLAPYVAKRPWLMSFLKPLSNWYANAAGYRQLGLRADDLIIEENEDVIKALKRLPPQASYDRVYRIRRAFQCSTVHQLLPKDQWTKPEEDVPYLSPILEEIKAEENEKKALDSLTVVRNH